MKQFCVCHVCSVLSSLIAVLYVPPRCIDKMHHDAILCVPRVQRSVVFDCYLFPQLCIGKMHHDAIFCLPRVQRSVVFDCYLSVVLHPAVYSRQGEQWRHFVCHVYVKHSDVFDYNLFPCYIGKVHFFLFIALSVILLLNLLIAMMGDTYAKVSVCLDPLFGSTK